MTTLKDFGLGDPSSFKGEPHKLDMFLQDCSLRFALLPHTFDEAAKQITYALSHMREGDASRWKEQYLKSRTALVTATVPFSVGTSWRTFENALRASFTEVDKEQDAMHKMQHLRQGKKTIDQHNIDFKLLTEKSRLTGAEHASTLIHFYRESIQPHIRERILMMDTPPTTIDEWFSRAAQFDGMTCRLNHTIGTSSYGRHKQRKHRNYTSPSSSVPT